MSNIPKKKVGERTDNVSIRIPREDNEFLEYVSSELGVTKSELIRNAISREVHKLKTVYGR